MASITRKHSTGKTKTTEEPLLLYHPQNHVGILCGRLRGMVVDEGGRSLGVLLYYKMSTINQTRGRLQRCGHAARHA